MIVVSVFVEYFVEIWSTLQLLHHNNWLSNKANTSIVAGGVQCSKAPQKPFKWTPLWYQLQFACVLLGWLQLQLPMSPTPLFPIYEERDMCVCSPATSPKNKRSLILLSQTKHHHRWTYISPSSKDIVWSCIVVSGSKLNPSPVGPFCSCFYCCIVYVRIKLTFSLRFMADPNTTRPGHKQQRKSRKLESWVLQIECFDNWATRSITTQTILSSRTSEKLRRQCAR